MDRGGRIKQLVQTCLDGCLGANDLDGKTIDQLLRSHPDLMPELGEELKNVGLILKAFRDALPAAASGTGALPSPNGTGSPASAAPSPAIPDYDLCHPIGRGSFGTVWLGRNRHEGQFYAVKLIHRAHALELDGIRAYKRRAGSHPHLVPIGHVGTAGPFLYYTMPLADDANGSAGLRVPQDYEALTLQRHCQRQAPLPADEVLTIADHLLSALDYLHAAGLLHKDVKPGNVLRLNGVWRLGDLGLMTPSEQPTPDRGTSAFWPPEGPRDRTADLYALGKTLYLLLTGAELGRFPEFAAGTLTIPGGGARAEAWRRVIVRACHQDPGQRWANAGALRRALAPLKALDAATGPPTAAAGGTTAAPAGKSKRKYPGSKWAFYTALVAAALAVAVGGVIWIPGFFEPPRIVELKIDHWDDAKEPVGVIGWPPSLTTRLDDWVRVHVEFSRPSYCYLIAYNPRGQEQLCYPEDDARQPERVTQLAYPRDAVWKYHLNDGVGMQAFVVIAARQALPPFAAWRRLAGPAPWKPFRADVAWSFDGQRFEALDHRLRADEPFHVRPKPFEDVCHFLKAGPGVEVIRGIAFPVQEKPALANP
jgi:hypothetical protein